MSTNRVDHLFTAFQSAGYGAMAINPGPTLTYLTGLQFHLSERPTVLVVVPGRKPALILPEFEAGKAKAAPIELEPFTYGDNPATWAHAFERAAAYAGLEGKTVGVEANRMRVLELFHLQKAAPTARFEPANTVADELRLQKDASEIADMRQAIRIAQTALSATLPVIRPGVSERDIAGELIIQLFRAGSDPELPFSPIVAGGPNGANPHAVPSDRKLESGDMLVIDWGGSHNGYFSDLTRTFAIHEVRPEVVTAYEAVRNANAAGRAAGKPGIPAGDVDRAARAEIVKLGYGEYFTHRTGHGLGMEVHESPYMFGENHLILQPGMVYTVEPGVYLSGNFGIRIEDDVVVTENGAETLSDFSRDLQVLG